MIPSGVPSDSPSLSLNPSSAPSNSAAPSNSSAPSNVPSLSMNPSESPVGCPAVDTPYGFSEVTAGEAYEALSGDGVIDLDMLGDDATQVIELGFDYKWFEETFTEVCLSSNGQINMGGEDSCDIQANCATIIYGVYVGKRIAFVQDCLSIAFGGSVKYVVNTSSGSCPSIKISFEGLSFGSTGQINVQVELFENGNIIICYGEGDNAGNIFVAGIEDSDIGAEYFPFAGFDDVILLARELPIGGIAFKWPTNRCYEFVMPSSLP